MRPCIGGAARTKMRGEWHRYRIVLVGRCCRSGLCHPRDIEHRPHRGFPLVQFSGRRVDDNPIAYGVAMQCWFAAIAFALMTWPALGQQVPPGQSRAPYHSNPALLSWIPSHCCVTNDCCWEITSDEIRHITKGNRWRVLSTDQTLGRYDSGEQWTWNWSRDGKHYRCACDHDAASNSWVRHQGAHTRCLFIPQRLF